MANDFLLVIKALGLLGVALGAGDANVLGGLNGLSSGFNIGRGPGVLNGVIVGDSKSSEWAAIKQSVK